MGVGVVLNLSFLRNVEINPNGAILHAMDVAGDEIGENESFAYEFIPEDGAGESC